MALKASKAPPAPQESEPAPDGPFAQFSRDLADRFPDRMVRRFVMPSNVTQAQEVFLLEITSREEIMAAINADAMMSLVEKSSVRLSADAEKRECIRLAIVGIGNAKNGRIVYRHTNHDGIPLVELNSWPAKAWTALHAFFGQLNGVPTEEIVGGILGALTVGAFAPPTHATPSAADPGK